MAKGVVDAARRASTRELEALAKSGADLNASARGYRPLQLGAWPPARALITAAFAGVRAYVDVLIAAGARQDGFTAAALGETSRVSTFELLLQRGANATATLPSTLWRQDTELAGIAMKWCDGAVSRARYGCSSKAPTPISATPMAGPRFIKRPREGTIVYAVRTILYRLVKFADGACALFGQSVPPAQAKHVAAG